MHEPTHSGPGLSLTQIIRADREIFNIMASEFSGSLIAEKDKAPPLDAVFLRLMHDPRVNVHLIAMPRISKNGRCNFGYHTCMRCLKPKHGAAACHSNAGS